MTEEPESVKVLRECIELQLKKSRDYQNPHSTVKQSDYYETGFFTIREIMHAKMLRTKSVMEAMMNDETYTENFESLEDSVKDLINYASFGVSYLRGKMPGQDTSKDIFNRKIKKKNIGTSIDASIAALVVESQLKKYPSTFEKSSLNDYEPSN